MGLNEQKGNMYGFVTHTWNAIKGKCMHDCPYCYMKRFPQNDLRLDKKELKVNLREGNFIFVGSSTDMFANDVSPNWIQDTMLHALKFNNTYLYQSKDPMNMQAYSRLMKPSDWVATTIETNDESYSSNAMSMRGRAEWLGRFTKNKKLLTMEPIVKFNLKEFLKLILMANPNLIAIGANTSNVKHPEPTRQELEELINAINGLGIQLFIKDNLKRILKG